MSSNLKYTILRLNTDAIADDRFGMIKVQCYFKKNLATIDFKRTIASVWIFNRQKSKQQSLNYFGTFKHNGVYNLAQ